MAEHAPTEQLYATTPSTGALPGDRNDQIGSDSLTCSEPGTLAAGRLSLRLPCLGAITKWAKGAELSRVLGCCSTQTQQSFP